MKKGDKRRLIAPLAVRTSFSIGTIPAGEVIEIQQGPDQYNNVLVDNVWMNKSMIEKISEPVGELA